LVRSLGLTAHFQDSKKLIHREALKHDRVPARRLRNPNMTVCTASMFFWLYDKDTNNFGSAIIAASDRKLSDTGLGIGYQGSRWKGAMFPSIKQLVLVSGDIVIHSAILRELIRNYKMVEATRLFLSPLNLNQAAFLAQQRTMESRLVSDLANYLINHKIDAEALVAGCDGEKEASLYRVDNNGLVTCHSDIGFVSIGSGGIHSSAYFMTLPYSHVTMYFRRSIILLLPKRRPKLILTSIHLPICF
jgi:hypothetical protein